MKPDSISLAAKEAIFSNLELTTFGYNSPLTLDQFISKISIVPVNAGAVYPNDLIANLPIMKLVLTWKKDNFIILDGANNVEINLPPLTADSGVGEFDFTISDTLETDMTDLFTDQLNNNYAPNKAKYESWTSYNSLPGTVKNALKAGISFNSNIDIPNVNTFANIIDTEKTVITKGVFPVGPTGEIEPIQIKLVLKPGRFVKIGGSSLASELPPINVSYLPIAEAKPYNFNGTAITQINKFIKKVQDSISAAATIDEKKTIYNSYANFDNLPKGAKDIIDRLKVRGVEPTDTTDIFLNSVIDSKIISIGEFPSVENQPIPKITLVFRFNKSSKFLFNQKDYYKRVPIDIDFKDILS